MGKLVEAFNEQAKKAREKEGNLIPKQILDRWGTAIVPEDAIWINKQGKSQVNQKKIQHYEERGYKGDEVLWIAPKDCIRFEFESDNDSNHRIILELESVAKSLELDYCITSHKGKSDYFNVFNIKGIPMGEDNQNAKLLFADMLIPSKHKDFLDRTNLGWTLSPIVEHKHWKKKYKGNIHKIIRGKNPLKHENIYPKELLKKLENTKKKYFKNNKFNFKNDWVKDFLLNYCCNNKLPAGARHLIIEKNLSALIIFDKEKEQIKNSYYKAQGREHDSCKTWERAILKGEYTQVNAGELAKFIKDYGLNYEIPKIKDSDKKENSNIFVDLNITSYKDNVKLFYEKKPFFYDDEKNLYWFWDSENKKWEMITPIRLVHYLDEKLNLNGQTITSKTKANYLESIRRIGIDKKPKELPKTWIQFKNKIVDLETDKEFEATPEYFSLNPIPWSVGDSEETPIFDKIFKQWVGEEYVQTLYEILSYCLIPDYPIQRLFCLIGGGSNGKSKYLEIVSKFVGDKNVGTTDLDILIDSRFDSADSLYKKLCCTMGETDFTTLKRTSLLKKLTGGDKIRFEFKNISSFTDINYAKIIISTNSLPTTFDKTDGFYRRWLIVLFPNKFSEKIDILSTIPDKEYENLSKKSIRILKQILKKREFTNEGSVEDRKKRYEENSNPLKKFINEICIINVNKEIPFFKFYDSFLIFLKQRNMRELSKIEVSKLLNQEGYEIKTRSVLVDSENHRYSSWKFILGLNLKENITHITDITQVSVSNSHIETKSNMGNMSNMGNKSNENNGNNRNFEVSSKLKWDKRCEVWRGCSYPKGDSICNEDPCNEFEGLYYCREHFEKIQEDKKC